MEERFDVIVLGAGLAGTTLSTILARHGHRVLLLERGQLPRFAIGEATLPQTSYWLWIMGACHELPALQTLANNDMVFKQISAACGVKKAISFLYHRDGQELDFREAYHLVPPEVPFSGETHLYRADVDAHMLGVARAQGVNYRDQTAVEGVEEIEGGLEVRAEGGRRFVARYVVDATGYRSPLAAQLGLRDPEPQAETSSRSIFCHFHGLRPFDELLPESERPDFPFGYHHGTQHHVFDGGWFWVIPFGNHGRAAQELASVGLTLDTRKHPRDPSVSPEEEFARHVRRHPTIARHLGSLQPARSFIGTDRIQYTSRQTVGDRWFVLGHAAAFIDPLYSRGLLQTFEVLHVFALALLDGLAADDLGRERFVRFERMQKAQVAYTDRIVSTAYRCTADFGLWSPWTQLWLLRKLFHDVWRLRTILRFLGDGDRSILRDVEEDPVPGASAPFATELSGLVSSFRGALTRYEAGALSADAASQAMYGALRAVDWLPRQIYRWGADDERHVNIHLGKIVEFIQWGKTAAPEAIRERAFDFELPPQLMAG